MRWLENLIAAISPQAAYKRAAFKAGLSWFRESYDSADHGRLNNAWAVNNMSAQLTDTWARDTVRARARDLERNSDMMSAVISAYNRNIVGKGFTLQARTSDTALNEQIESLWREWIKCKNCDITKTQNLNQILRMLERRKKIDGGILIHKCYTGGGLLPFKLQCLEVDELARDQIQPSQKGNIVIDGVEVDRNKTPVGYWIKQYSLDGWSEMDAKFIKATDIIYKYTKTRPSQIREMSDMSPTITRVRDTQEFMTAVSVKQRIEACLSVFIKRAMPSGSLGRGSSSNEPRSTYDGKMLTPGMISYIDVGDEVQVVNPSGQASDSSQFIKQQQLLMAAGQGLSYEAVTRDMSQTNYSSARQGLIEDDLTYAEDREHIEEIMDEIYETFIISAVLTGKIAIRDFWQNKSMYFKHEWIQVPKRWIDPLKETTAAQIGLLTGQKTLKEVAAESGKDWKDHIDDMVDVINYGKEKGIDLGGVIYGQNYTSPEQRNEA